MSVSDGQKAQAAVFNAAFVSKTTQTTKGDLIGRSTTGPERVPVGTNGQVLVADSAQTTGVAYSSRLTDAESDISGLQTDVGVLQTDVGTLQTDVGTLQTDVGTLQTDVGTLQTNVGTLQTDVGTLQTNVGTLQTDVGSLQTDVGTLQTDVATLQTDVSNLQSLEGLVNYITNGKAITDTSGWVTYSDPAGAQPVDGVGSTANITWTRSTTSPIRGTAHFLFTKDAVNRQGQGVSYDFTIADADKDKVLRIEFDYKITSGTYASGDLTAYIYNVDSSAVIQPINFSIQTIGSSLVQKGVATFKTSTTSTNYRLIFHTASTSALAYTLAFDEIKVSPQQAFTPLVVRAQTAAGQNFGATSSAIVIFGTELIDTHNAYNAATGVFTAPHPGRFLVASAVSFDNIAANKIIQAMIRKNSASYALVDRNGSFGTGADTFSIGGAAVVDLLATETIDVFAYNGDSVVRSLTASGPFNHLSIVQIG